MNGAEHSGISTVQAVLLPTMEGSGIVVIVAGDPNVSMF